MSFPVFNYFYPHLLLFLPLAMGALINNDYNDNNSNHIMSRSPTNEHISYDNTKDWPIKYPECVGNRQSPIEISHRQAIDIEAPPIWFGLYDVPMAKPIVLHNSGHTVQFQVPTTSLGRGRPFITGGRLQGKYVVEQTHFHWGSAGRKGSEHALNGRRYDLEMHIVHYDAKHGNVNVAKNFANGIAVIAVLFQVAKRLDVDQPGLEVILKNLKDVQVADTSVTATEIFSLGSLLANVDRADFYTYQGSLTTPPCTETVTWIVFAHVLPILRSDLKKFWDLKDSKGNRYVNTRSLQSNLDRNVYHIGHFTVRGSAWNFGGFIIKHIETLDNLHPMDEVFISKGQACALGSIQEV
uniref:Carbonic anhydrase n=1 Tax=Glossina pallidipes TaxID=7398 RepID=A0A1A9ZJJ5_GLOPL